ncbi:putative allantoin permease [compost metagenome]
MTIWAINVGGGIQSILTYKMTQGPAINPVYGYLIVIASVLAVWAAPGVSVSDFTQNAKSQKAQTIGQIGSLFVGYFIFAIMAVVIIIGGTIHYGAPTSGNGILDFINQWDSLPAILLTTLVFLLTTISTNATGNIIPAGYQLAALFPKSINYRKGVIIAGVVSVLIMPWRFMSGGSAIIVFLNGIGALLGPVAGVMIVHYYFVQRQTIDLNQLYYDEHEQATNRSIYNSVNVKAYIATLAGLILSLIGQFIPVFSFLSDIAWIAGFVTAFIIYWILIKVSPNK